MRNISDLMMSLTQLTDTSVRTIRKTAKDPPRISVYDLGGAVTGQGANARGIIYKRLAENFPELLTICCGFKFTGQGQQPTPVVDARGAVQIVMLLPGRAAASVRKDAASCRVRFMGGDLTMIDDIARNHLALSLIHI